jgi:peptidyl-dipeptidase A
LNGANDGFHEAIGDMVALSITPEYLVQIGMLNRNQVPSADKDIGLLLRQALEKVPGLPWTLLVDRYRWGIFDGTIKPADYNNAWTKIRLDYQGVKPPVERPADAFDPGAKYHIPGNVPYTRYFLARILQFQFYKAACDAAGWTGPLHRCSFYGNKEVGTRLNAMLEMGASKPWPDALEAFTGTRQMSGTALVEYFAPLKAWLDEQNKGQPQGW